MAAQAIFATLPLGPAHCWRPNRGQEARRESWFSGDAQVDDPLGLLQPVAKSVLKDRHHSPCRLSLGRDQPVDLGERAGQGFSQTSCLPAASAARVCVKCSPGGVQMSTLSTSSIRSSSSNERVRRETENSSPRAASHPSSTSHSVAHSKLVGVPSVAFGNMAATDAAADDSDGPDPGLRHPVRTARQWLSL